MLTYLFFHHNPIHMADIAYHAAICICGDHMRYNRRLKSKLAKYEHYMHDEELLLCILAASVYIAIYTFRMLLICQAF